LCEDLAHEEGEIHLDGEGDLDMDQITKPRKTQKKEKKVQVSVRRSTRLKKIIKVKK
jgi:hypothetical protein